uniref:Uncharacterized protein n=1 Tax=Ascaris lumbricoides TaxID=6252 RepID=A0A0M3HIV9_ASCLU
MCTLAIMSHQMNSSQHRLEMRHSHFYKLSIG